MSMKAIRLDTAKQWLDDHCENPIRRISVWQMLCAMPFVEVDDCIEQHEPSVEDVPNAYYDCRTCMSNDVSPYDFPCYKCSALNEGCRINYWNWRSRKDGSPDVTLDDLARKPENDLKKVRYDNGKL